VTVVGRVVALYRYPVKSMAAESLDAADVSWHGLAGDRRWAFVRAGQVRSGFPWLTIRERPELLHYVPRFAEPDRPNASKTLVRTPSGSEYDVADPKLSAGSWSDAFGRVRVTQSRSESAILVEGLTKSFGEVRALRGIDLVVPRGTVLGVLGPNGAGKTTAVRILTTLLQPDSGRALVEGRDVVRDPAAVRRVIGLSGQSAAIQEELTGRENLEIIGRLYHLTWRRARTRAIELLDRFGLTEAADRQAKNYSGGMQRRLDLAASLVGDPRVLFLDEPTTGLDPRSRLGMWDIIRSLVATGTTTLLTTQYLDEADELADQIVVIDHGLVIAAGTAEELKSRVGGDVLEFTVPDRSRISDAVAAVVAVGEGEPKADKETGVVSVGVGGRGSDALVDAVRGLDSVGVRTQGLALRRPSLDDVFLALTGHATEEDGQSPDRRGKSRRGQGSRTSGGGRSTGRVRRGADGSREAS
jgi:ABC-2 type transport system ATP-binding protein